MGTLPGNGGMPEMGPNYGRLFLTVAARGRGSDFR